MPETTEYIYRVVYRVKPSEWPAWRDPAENVWKPTNNKPYLEARYAKSTATRENNTSRSHEFKVQYIPADNWQFLT